MTLGQVVVTVNATAPSGEFSIALHCGTSTEGNHQNIALQLRPDMQSDMVQLRSRLSGIWIGAQSVNGTPFTAQQPFSIALAVQLDHFDIAVNGMYFASYDYPVAGRSNMTIYAQFWVRSPRVKYHCQVVQWYQPTSHILKFLASWIVRRAHHQ